MANLKSLAFVSALAVASALAPQASAAPFTPVMDEFWILKGDSSASLVETFRDSFDDGVVPESGPQDGLGGNPDTYTSFGGAGFTDESGGKLTITPALGDPTVITGVLADTATGATKLRTLASGTPGSLGFSKAFEIHGLFDLSDIPDIVGESFGIALTDRALGLGNLGNDVPRLHVVKSVGGVVGVRFGEFDFIGDTNELVDFVSIQSFLPSAAQIELVLTKEANSNAIGANFMLYDGVGSVLFASGAMDTVNDVTGSPVTIYDGESYTRAQFFATDTGIPIPAPATLALFGVGLAALGVLRRRR